MDHVGHAPANLVWDVENALGQTRGAHRCFFHNLEFIYYAQLLNSNCWPTSVALACRVQFKSCAHSHNMNVLSWFVVQVSLDSGKVDHPGSDAALLENPAPGKELRKRMFLRER